MHEWDFGRFEKEFVTDQLTVVGGQAVGVGVREEQELGVGVHGQVGLDVCLVPAEEVGHVLDLHLRLRLGPTEGITAGVAGGSGCYGEEPSKQRCHVGEEKY